MLNLFAPEYRYVLAATATLVLAALASNQAEASDEKFVRSFLDAHCVRCHNAKNQKGKFLLDALPDIAGRRSSYAAILEQLRAGDMPPKKEPQPDEKKASRVYRLPTEAEWEYACRAGKQTIFHWGDSLSSRQANFKGDGPYGGAEKGPRIGKTVKCGSYQANAWGLFDMHSNVWEWCLDGPRKFEQSDKPIQDPRGPMDAGGSRVLRGGSWLLEAWRCRSALRTPLPLSSRYYDVGFRVVVER